jgi:hypothetical protein
MKKVAMIEKHLPPLVATLIIFFAYVHGLLELLQQAMSYGHIFLHST